MIGPVAQTAAALVEGLVGQELQRREVVEAVREVEAVIVLPGRHLAGQRRFHRRKSLPHAHVVGLLAEEGVEVEPAAPAQQRHGQDRRHRSPEATFDQRREHPHAAHQRIAGQDDDGRHDAQRAISLRRFAQQRQHAAQQREDKPQHQQAAAVVFPAVKAIAQPQQEQRPGHRIKHRLAGQVVARVVVALHVEHLQVRHGIVPQRLVAAGPLHVIEHAHLAGAVPEGEGIAQIGAGQRRKGHTPDEEEDDQPRPGAAQEAPLDDDAGEDVGSQRGHHQAGGQVGVHAQAQQQAAQGEVPQVAAASAPQQKIGRSDLEERRRHLVPAPAAHVHVPAVDGQEEGGRQRCGHAEHAAGQRVKRRHGQQGGDERGGFQRHKVDAHGFEQPQQVVGVHGGRLEPARAKGRIGAAFQDVQGIGGGVGLVHEDARRHAVEVVYAHEDGEGEDSQQEQCLGPQRSRGAGEQGSRGAFTSAPLHLCTSAQEGCSNDDQ